MQGGTGGDGGPATTGSGGPGGTGEGPRVSARQAHNYYANQRNINITNISIFSLLLPGGHMAPQHGTRAVDEMLNDESHQFLQVAVRALEITTTVVQSIVRSIRIVFCRDPGDSLVE
ncbi:hypothetical protein B0H11DRAFT_1926842 [Mycena galericulata]|nr:hypothetical protein B0H11DRAFT_1926842 [Mycena galericulata]